ncbi:MAG TPA: OmpA family protein [Candidatus Binatia bacterium]|jgi:K(+)-stimulated pyrophosphate-energized sodium pump
MARNERRRTEPRRETQNWPVPVIVLSGIALVGLAWLYAQSAPILETMVPARAARMADLELPGGVNVSVPEGSLNYSLQQWLADTTDATVPKRFAFDDLDFEADSAKLTPDSVATINSLVTILQAYPAVAVRLEVHSENGSDALAGKQLSFDRAITLRELMIRRGIDETRIDAEAYADEKPVAASRTEEGRAENRRIELVVAER